MRCFDLRRDREEKQERPIPRRPLRKCASECARKERAAGALKHYLERQIAEYYNDYSDDESLDF